MNYTRRDWIIWGSILLFLVIVSFFFGTATKALGIAVATILAGGAPQASVFSLPLAVGLLMFVLSFVTLFVRPKIMLLLAYGVSAAAILIGWEVWSVNILLVLLYFIACVSYYHLVEKQRQNFVKFNAASARAGHFFITWSLLLIMSGGVFFGGHAYMSRNHIEVPAEQIEKVSTFLTSNVSENQPDIAKRQVSKLVEDKLNAVFQRVVKPGEQNLAWVIVIALFLPMLIVLAPISWLVQILLSVLIWSFLKAGLLRKVPQTLQGEDIALLE